MTDKETVEAVQDLVRTIQILTEMITQTPNDQQLGSRVRELFKERTSKISKK